MSRSIPWTSPPRLCGPLLLRSLQTLTNTERLSATAQVTVANDQVAIAVQVISAIQQIVSRRISAISPAVVSITTIHGGVKENVIADRVELGGTIRTTGGAARQYIIDELERALSVGRALGATCELQLFTGYDATINDPKVTDVIRDAARKLLGPERVIEMPFDPWSEDFGYMTARVPGAMFWLGVTSERVPNPIWHSSMFDLDEDALPIAAMVLAASVQDLLKLHIDD